LVEDPARPRRPSTRAREERALSTEYSFTRRKLIGVGAGAAAATAFGTRVPAALAAGDSRSVGEAFSGPALMPPERIGIQLFTIRDQVSSLGFAEVFETLAAIGYEAVEFAGYTQGSVGPITVAQIRQLMDANGLVGVGSHVSINDGNIQQVLDAAEILGLPYVGLASASSQTNTVSGWQQTADNFNRWGAATAARGVRFYWHNHQSEFGFTLDQPTRRIYDILLEETDPALVFMEMDIYWAYVGQYLYGRAPFPTFEPLDYVTANRSRYPLFHVKEGKRNQASQNGYDMDDVGQGHIDFETFFCGVGEKDSHWYLYERDNASSHPKGSMVSSECSYLYMRHGLLGC
jgi:sugar phosphate isomerase/epimerase